MGSDVRRKDLCAHWYVQKNTRKSMKVLEVPFQRGGVILSGTGDSRTESEVDGTRPGVREVHLDNRQ